MRRGRRETRGRTGADCGEHTNRCRDPRRAVGDARDQPGFVGHGTVETVSDGKVTLQDGTTFALDPQRPVSRLVPATIADLQPGSVVAITGRRQADNTMAASLVRILAAAPNSPTFFGQSALDAGNLMTNATVDKVSGSSFTVTFPGGGAQVTLAPGGQVTTVASGTASDLKVGATVFAQVRDGVAQQLSVQ